ncbi:MAG: hypothetical protein KAX67_07765 [Pararheinheimera sp.]|nr:hypothetical protein [Rheinheimera sp.]
MSNIIKMIGHLQSPKELLLAYEAIKQRLQHLGYSSSHTDPVGQYAEHLVAKLYSAQRTRNGTAGCDLISHDNLRIEVKCRVARRDGYVPKTYIMDSNVQSQFDYLVYIVFDKNYEVLRAVGMTVDVFKQVANYVKHANSAGKWVYKASEKNMQQPGVDDLTQDLRELGE